MNILFLEPQPCIRALKYAAALRKKRVNLYFGYTEKTLTQFYGFGDNLFKAWIKLPKNKKLPRNNARIKAAIREAVSRYKIDLIHSHNAPDFLTVAAVGAVKGRIPVIHDNHDFLSIRKLVYPFYRSHPEVVLEEEKIANTKSSGRIHVTAGIKELVEQKYDVPAADELVFPNYVSEELIPEVQKPKLSDQDGQLHLVYEGNLSNDCSHYDLARFFRGMARQKAHVHIYAARENAVYKAHLAYSALAERSPFIHFHGHLDPRTLMQEMTQYDLGWAGFNDKLNWAHLQIVLANKVVEYMACGLPVVSFPHPTQAAFIKAHKAGFVIKNIKELKKIKKAKIKTLSNSLWKRRKVFTMEKKINKVLKFYRRYLNRV